MALRWQWRRLGAWLVGIAHTSAWASAGANGAAGCAFAGILIFHGVFSLFEAGPREHWSAETAVAFFAVVGAGSGLLLAWLIERALRWRGRLLPEYSPAFYLVVLMMGAVCLASGAYLERLSKGPYAIGWFGLMGIRGAAALAIAALGVAAFRIRLGHKFTADDAARMMIAAILVAVMGFDRPADPGDAAIGLLIWLAFVGGIFGQILWAERAARRPPSPAPDPS